MFKDVAELIAYSVENGEVKESKTEVFVNKKSLARQEFYASYQAGLNPTCTFELRVEDFEMTKRIEEGTGKPLYATKLIHEGGEYNIIRSYEKSNGMVELVCS